MKKILVLIEIALILGALMITSGSVNAETTEYWAKTYEGYAKDYARAVSIADNGDIIVVGYTESFGAGSYDVWVLRLDSKGNVKWQKTYGGKGWDRAHAVAIAENGDIIVVGDTSFGAGKSDLWVLRLDKEGHVKWQKTYGGRNSDWGRAVAIASNGDIIAAGGTRSFGAGMSDIWVLRLDSGGNVNWQKTYGGSGEEWATEVALDPNKDIIVVGNAGGDVSVLSLDSTGNIKWQKTYSGRLSDVANAVAIAENRDIIVAGHTRSFGDSSGATWVLRLDSNGNARWQKTYSGNYQDIAYAVVLAPNEDIIVVGSDLLRLNPDGKLKWAKRVGGEDIKILPDGTTVLVGGNFLVARFNVDEAPEYSGWGWKNATLEVHDSNAEVEWINPQGGIPNVNINTSNAEVHNTEATVETQWPQTTLKVSSEPSGAKVYINGKYRGTTPLTLELSSGNYTVELSRTNYEDYTVNVTLETGETKTISATLTPKFGYLDAYSNPPGAEVYVDEDYLGTTPITDHKLPLGEHTIKVKMEDYKEYTKTINIELGKTTKVEATLSAIPATFKVSSNPSGADVYINGKYRGTTPLTLELSPGTHSLTISKNGYKEYVMNVTLEAGETVGITVQFENKTTTTDSNNDNGICGPALIIALALIPILKRRG
ncbi:hypothetical protein GQS_09000 [Thermococcus sp. 4557]|uniref:PEGA domain-containing protein n=1 Tax=Thermococcus sp. (strain CGMCC 1.5172 / 4557) TaxID=1042877 RepID=UPI000219EF6A|nr:PEGA domain-containing protein [Thermococcus sp. 4557]AEK73694.1 hypothetical protein GQS_09000 [Thermococcus sp. 4557]